MLVRKAKGKRKKAKVQRFDRKKFLRAGKRSSVGRGLTILYVGDGKGKTTAAVGVAVRAVGAGLRVVFLQFMKTEKWQSYERRALTRLGVTVRVLGMGFVGIIDDMLTLKEHKEGAAKALATTLRSVRSGDYDLVVADEAVSAVDEGLLTVDDIRRLIAAKPTAVTLVLTGHSRYPRLEAACDLVTDMRKVKHPFDKGLLAQRGIDF